MFQNKIKTFGRDLLLVIDRVSALGAAKNIIVIYYIVFSKIQQVVV